MIDFGTVLPGTDLFIPFNTFSSDDPSASMTISGLAATDIEVYKDGSVTQRASDTGYALLDTDGIDFDGTTGIHGISINLASNATGGFYAAGHQYWVAIGPITLDVATVNFWAATFRIGYPNAILNTTVNTYSTATSFTLNEGSADDDAYNDYIMLAHDVASSIQTKIGFVKDYTGASKTIALVADPGIFTLTAADNISLFLPSNVGAMNGTLVIGVGSSGDKLRTSAT